MDKSFVMKLTGIMAKNDSLLCLGLDPDPVRLNLGASSSIKTDLIRWAGDLIDRTKDVICSVKPNIAFYEQFGLEGLHALKQILMNIPAEIPVIMDAKRGDIGSTAEAYARSIFNFWNADAVTLSPYLGEDSIKPFLDYSGKMVFILCQTSNPSAHQIQNHGIPYLYERVAVLAQQWGSIDQIGFVAGATQIDALARLRRLAPASWLLTPGVGSQGADLEEAIKAGLRSVGTGLVVPISRSVIYAEDVRAAAGEFREKINQAVQVQQTQTKLGPGKEKLIDGLFQTGCVKFGRFILASGKESPIYIDLRRIISFPELYGLCLREYTYIAAKLQFDLVSAVPYAALPLTAGIMQYLDKPMIYPRKETKSHGTGQMIEGHYTEGQVAVLIEDVVTTGGSILATIESMRIEQLAVNDVIVLVDRMQGGEEALAQAGCRMHSILNIEEIIRHLFDSNKIDQSSYKSLLEYIHDR